VEGGVTCIDPSTLWVPPMLSLVFVPDRPNPMWMLNHGCGHSTRHVPEERICSTPSVEAVTKIEKMSEKPLVRLMTSTGPTASIRLQAWCRASTRVSNARSFTRPFDQLPCQCKRQVSSRCSVDNYLDNVSKVGSESPVSLHGNPMSVGTLRFGFRECPG